MLMGEQGCSRTDLVWSLPVGVCSRSCSLWASCRWFYKELASRSGGRLGVGRQTRALREQRGSCRRACLSCSLVGPRLIVGSTMAVNSALLAGFVRRCSQRPMIGGEQMGLSPAAPNGVEQRSVAPGSALSPGLIYVFAGRRLGWTTFTQERSTNGVEER